MVGKGRVAAGKPVAFRTGTRAYASAKRRLRLSGAECC